MAYICLLDHTVLALILYVKVVLSKVQSTKMCTYSVNYINYQYA